MTDRLLQVAWRFSRNRVSGKPGAVQSAQERDLESKQGELTTPPIRCRFGHDHPPGKVTAATHNPANQPRPYHCPSCREANRWDKRPEHWEDYVQNDRARMTLHPEPCSVCFPIGLEGGY
jgi:hypothetical protein